MRVLRLIAQIPFEILQYVLMGLSVVLSAGGRVLDRAGRVVFRRLYYPVCLVRRRVNGEPPWKPIDATIGIKAPPDWPRCKHGVPQGVECFWCTSGQEPMELVVSEASNRVWSVADKPDKDPP
jgi:hypothetical protein